jgi:peptidoglycan hydrolase CwlO-like protein
MNERNLPVFLGLANLVGLVLIALVLLIQLPQIQEDVSAASNTSSEAVLEAVRDLDRRVSALDAKIGDMTARFDRLDASVAQIPNAPQEEDTRIGTILSELQALQNLVGGLSLDLGIVCDVIGC